MSETFLVVSIILAIGLPIIFLSAYKIYRWLQTPATSEAVQRICQQRKKAQKLTFAQPVYKFREFLFWFYAALVLLTIAFSYQREYRKVFLAIMIAAIFVSLLANNFLINKYWRCPFCQKRLPIRIGRSGARPKTVFACPFCQKSFLEGQE